MKTKLFSALLALTQLAELQRELDDLVGSRPITPEELAKAQKDQTLKLAGAWETLGHVAHSVAVMAGRASRHNLRLPNLSWRVAF